MGNFADVFKAMGNVTKTENGGKAFSSTNGGALLDLYAKIGGMRKREASEIISDWRAARVENKELADNLILYARDIRSAGLGERRIGRILLKELAKLEPEKVKRNFQTIVDCGRWDDLFIFVGTPIEDDVWNFIETQFRADVNGMKQKAPISLFAKWAPSINTSSRETRQLARKLCTRLKITERTYRKSLSAMRSYLNVVEKLMSAGEWDKINFEAVPSVAMSRYINTYNKRCQERFAEYKASLEKGTAKVNAATLYPYDITLKYLNNGRRLDPVDEAQWKALPNYVKDEYSVVVMADVSGSMSWDNNRPLATSIGLATYFAQRNKGAYHNMYLTFTNDSHFITIKDGDSLASILRNVVSKGIGYNTNIESAFQAIYDVARISHETPKALVIISDGEFDRYATDYRTQSIIQKWNDTFIRSGLNPVKVISWNVACRNDHYMATADDNVSFCSGFGVGPFNDLTELIECNAYEAMVKILSKPAYCWK